MISAPEVRSRFPVGSSAGEHGWLIDHRSGNRHPFTLTTGKFIRAMLLPALQPSLLHQPRANPASLLSGDSSQQEWQLDVLYGRQPGNEMERQEMTSKDRQLLSPVVILRRSRWPSECRAYT